MAALGLGLLQAPLFRFLAFSLSLARCSLVVRAAYMAPFPCATATRTSYSFNSFQLAILCFFARSADDPLLRLPSSILGVIWLQGRRYRRMLCESPKNGGKADFAERTNRPRMREVESRPQHNTKRRRKVSGSSTGAKTHTTPKIDEGNR